MDFLVVTFFKERAQISFTILPLHRPEEKSRGLDCGRILPFTEGEAQIHDCRFVFYDTN